MNRESIPFRAFIWMAVLFILSGVAAGQKIAIKTEEGIPVVYNPVQPVPRPDGPSGLALTEDLVIGRNPASEPPLFAQLRSVGVDDEGYIWTLDWMDFKIRIFDPAGQFVTAFGKQGQGPQEWQSPGRMIVLPEGTGVVLDLNKLTFYAREGLCFKEISTAQARMFRMRIDSKGFIYGDDMEFGPGMTMKVKKYDSNLKYLSTVASVEVPINPPQINAFTALILCHVDRGDRLTWAINTKYDFHVHDPDGRPLRRFMKSTKTLRVPAAEKEKILAEYGERRSQVFVPDEYPPFYSFIGDPEGRLYVRTYERNERGWILYDVFDPEGRCFTRTALPEDELMFAIRHDKLYVMIQEDEAGRPLVKRYAMNWK